MKNKKEKAGSGSSKGISRRGFLRGAGLSTAGSVLLTSEVFAFEYEEEKGTELGPEGLDHSDEGQRQNVVVER